MNSNSSSANHHPIVTWGAGLTGIGLILLGLHVLIPELAAWGYGVTPLDANGKAYLFAAGARDLSLGLMTLYLAKCHRSTLGMFFLFMLVIPIADTLIVLIHGTAWWKVAPHAAGLVVIGVISYFAFQEKPTG